MLSIIKLFWKEIALAVFIIAIIGGIYYEGYQHGKHNCQEAYVEQKTKEIEAINKRVDEIKTTSDVIAKNQVEDTEKVKAGLDKIISDLKKKPSGVVNNYTTVKDCKPSDSYVEAWNEISKKANSK